MQKMAQLNLPYGKGSLPVTIQDSYLGSVAQPGPVKPASDVQKLIQEAVNHPIGSPPLTRLVHPGQRIAIITDDFTRKTPVAKILPVILDLLKSSGIEKKQIQIIVALGTHRPMTTDELELKMGAEIMAQYEVINQPSDNQNEMVYVGTSSDGIPAWVNRRVAEADIRIGVGMITPHSDTGFSGGCKIILPGVCNSLTVNTFHAVGAFLGETQLGKVESPLRKNLETFVSERVPLTFILNVIANIDMEIFQCVAGHPILAHRQGINYATEAFGVPIQRRFDVVVANCYPYDVDLWQSTKGVFCGSLITADGGTLIMLTAATEGNSNYPRFPHYIGCEPEELERKIKNGQVSHANLMAESIKLGTLKKRVRLVLVSGGLTEANGNQMGIPRYPTVEAAVAEAIERLPLSKQKGAVCVLPQAGVTLPIELNA
jgi:nickel-dependent lactate racemase